MGKRGVRRGQEGGKREHVGSTCTVHKYHGGMRAVDEGTTIRRPGSSCPSFTPELLEGGTASF